MKHTFLLLFSFFVAFILVRCGSDGPGSFEIVSATTGSGQVTLAWGESTRAAAYEVSYGTASGTYETVVTKTATSPFTVTGLTNGTGYYFMVTAIKDFAITKANGEISATPGGSLTIAAGVKNLRSIGLTWEAVSGAASYVVKYGTASGTYGTTASTTATSPFTFNGITGTFYFLVQALSSTGGIIASGEKRPIQSIGTGYEGEHTCHLSSAGKVKCWGSNSAGQLGKGNTTDLGDGAGEMGSNLTDIDLGTGRTAVQVAVGSTFTCALLDNATVKCWGENPNGVLGKGHTNALGDGANEMGDNLTAIDLGTGRTAVQITTGNRHACALLDNATVKCWGYNNDGALGKGNTNHLGDGGGEMGDALTAIDLGTGRTAVQIAAGGWHNCALLDNATVKCWGVSTSGQLGKGNSDSLGDGANEMGDNLTAISLGTGRTAVAIANGAYDACAILDNGSLKCWGDSTYGELGKGNTNNLGDGGGEMGDSLTAIDLGTGRTAKQVSAGQNQTCAILDNDTVKCWGRGQYGSLGKGNTNDLGDGANEMGDNLTAIDLGTGRVPILLTSGVHNCAVLDNGTVKCWGQNNKGQLGYGNTSNLGDGASEMGSNLSALDLGL